MNEVNNEIEFTVVAREELMQRCILEINGVSGSDFELIKFDQFEVPLCTLRVTKWKPQYIFKLGELYQRFKNLPPELWRIKKK